MKIYLMRHGEVFNPDNVIYSQLPGFHLSQEGRDHIQQVSEAFQDQNLGIKHIYCSPLERCQETAQIMADDLRIEPENIYIKDALIDADAGNWVGKSADEFFAYKDHHKDTEPIEKMNQRMMTVLKEVVDKGEDALVISSADPIISVAWTLLDKLNEFTGQSEFLIPRGNFFKIEVDDDGIWQIGELNEF